MSDLFPYLIWFSLSLGASQEAALNHWVAPKPQPKVWQQATLKSRTKAPIGIYLRGEFDPVTDQIRPSVMEHIFEKDKLVVTTLYFAQLSPAKTKKLFNGWLQYEFGPRPPTPSAVYETKGRVTTYYVTPSVTWKWVTDDGKLVARVSSNERVPTALAEAVALGYVLPTGVGTANGIVEAYAHTHRSLLNGETPLPKLRALLQEPTLPPLMKADVEMVIAMILSAQFKAKAQNKTSPSCDYGLLDEALALAPALGSDIQKLREQCGRRP